ncbi:MAG: hypothetical protein JWP94_1538 [Mucilaginibacter sp.]|nr:hypothetical protein [Mucilaginibacter sp.]
MNAITGIDNSNEGKKEGTRLPDSESTRLKSDFPLSEKDEVKKAETKLRKAVKKQEQKKKL